MYVNHKLKMDLAGPAVMQKVDMVQRDQYVRKLMIELYCGGERWEIPADVHPIICYQKADGTGGEYDTLPDGRRAWSAEGNVLTVEIAPQMLTAPGPVRMAVDILQGDAKLSTFTVMLYVQKAIPLGLTSGDYFKLEGFLPIPEKGEMGQLLRISHVSDSGSVTMVEGYDFDDAVNDALEQAKESGAFDGKSAYQVALDNGFEGTEAEWLESLKGKGISAALGDIAQINITGQLTTDYNVTVDFNSSRLQRVKTPVADTDGANKAYVDVAVANCGVAAAPDYWQSALDEAADTVTALQDLGGREAVSFVWFSDMELSAGDSAHTGTLAAEMMERCHIPIAVCSGDAIAGELTSESAWRDAHKHAGAVLKPIGADKLLLAQGVNDGSRGADSGIVVNEKLVYGAMFRKQEADSRRVFGGNGTYYYMDIPGPKVRFIVLNSCCRQDGTVSFGFGNEQINWLASTALQFPEEGWAVVLFCHVPPTDSRISDSRALLNVLYAMENNDSFEITSGTEEEDGYVSVSGDFTSLPAAEVVGFFCGCAHKDTMERTPQSYRVITITSNADFSSDAQEETRVSGTDNEHALDIVTIDRATATVSMTRLGVGSSRSFYL